MRVDGGLAPLAVVAFGIFLLCVLDTCAKGLMETHATPAVVLMRYGAGAAWSVPMFLLARPAWPDARSLLSNFLRAFVVLGTAFTFFYALSKLPFAETIAITFTTPIFIALLGRVILKERIAGNIVLAVLLGSLGVVVILGARLTPGSINAQNIDGVVAALLSAVFYAFATVLLRKQTARDPIVNIVLLQNICCAVLALPAGLATWTAPTRSDLWLIAAAGLFGTGGHVAMAWGYKRAVAARLGALEYTGFIWAALLGWAFFNETPSLVVLAGAVLIVAGAGAASWGARAGEKIVPVEEV